MPRNVTLDPEDLQHRFAQRVAFEELVSRIAAEFINLAPKKIDDGIRSALAALGEHLGADRALLYRTYERGMRATCTHAWQAGKAVPHADRIALYDYPWFNKRFKLRGGVLLNGGEGIEQKLPGQEEGEAALGLPITLQGAPWGFLVFTACSGPGWSEEFLPLLQLLGMIFASALARLAAAETLNESETTVRALFETAPEGVAIIQDERLSYANRAFHTLFGLRLRGSALGRSVTSFIAPAERQRAAEKLADRQTSHTAMKTYEFTACREDGCKFPAAVTATNLSLAGEPATMAVVQDLTERQRTEAALRTSEANYTAIFNSANDALFVHDIETGKILDINRKVHEMFGYSRKEMLALSVGSISAGEAPYTGERALELMHKAAKDGSCRFDWLGRDRLGRRFWIEVSLKRATIEGVERILAAVRDISERKHAEAALRTSEERHRSLFDGIPVGVYRTTPAGEVIDVNLALVKMLEYPDRDTLLSHNMTRNYLRPDDRRRWQQEMEQKGVVHDFEVELKRYDGKVIWVRNSAQVVWDAEGKLQYFEGSLVDITDRKRSEAKLRETMVDLERSNKELKQFAHVASHDLQEPLRMIASFLQLLEKRYKGQLDQTADEYIEYAVNGARRLQTLIIDLLSLSRIRTKARPFRRIETEAVLTAVCDNLLRVIEDTKGSITHDVLPEVTADESQLIQVFQNLVENGLKFHSDAPPEIHVGAERRENEWVFSVRDNGIGIDPQYKERIFVIFQRLRGIVNFPGTGVGLTIAKGIIERHGGRIWVESEPREGATFYFTIPLRDEDVT